MKIAIENTPSWLQIPINYYKPGGRNLRIELFQYVTKDKCDEKYNKVVAVILTLLQLAAVMLDDIFDNTETRHSQPAMHTVYGTTIVSTWAIGITHYIYEIIADNFPVLLSIKFATLYNKVVNCTLKGQCYELTTKDYKQTAKFKTCYYTICFPVAIHVLFTTEDLDKATKIMEDKDLSKLGYLLQTENDFKG